MNNFVNAHACHDDNRNTPRGVFSRERSLTMLIAAILAGTMLLPLSACGGSDSDTSALSSDSASESATPSESASPSETPESSASPSDDASAQSDANSGSYNASGAAVDMLATLPVKGRAPKTGYARTQFGAAWSDVDHNGCDTRNDILKRDMTNVTFKSGTHDCVVKTGTLNDPYTGKTINFVRGQHTSTAVQIDHVVAVQDAWASGLWGASAQERLTYANDPDVLLAVDGPANEQKGSGVASLISSKSRQAATRAQWGGEVWMPSNKAYRCDYMVKRVEIKTKYGLSMTQAEKTETKKVLEACPME